jgi:cephalosporin-C deacetylase
MPLLDMPLAELKTYTGINPRPADFDEYWARALAELDAVDPDVELRPADFQASFAECFDLYFTGAGGARVYAKYLRPRNRQGGDQPGPAVVQFHGYTGSSGNWTAKLAWVAAGMSVASLDVRGQGGLSRDNWSGIGTTCKGHIIRGLEDHPDKLFYRNVFLDTARLARIVMGFDEVDAGRVGATGASQGGALTLACAALVPQIKRAAPVYPFLSDYKRVWEMDLIKQAYAEIPEFFRRHDPMHERIDTWWEKLGYIDIQHLAPRIEAEVLMGVGLMDQCCPPSTQFAAYNKITSAKDMKVFPDYGHEPLLGMDDLIFGFLSGL